MQREKKYKNDQKWDQIPSWADIPELTALPAFSQKMPPLGYPWVPANGQLPCTAQGRLVFLAIWWIPQSFWVLPKLPSLWLYPRAQVKALRTFWILLYPRAQLKGFEFSLGKWIKLIQGAAARLCTPPAPSGSCPKGLGREVLGACPHFWKKAQQSQRGSEGVWLSRSG